MLFISPWLGESLAFVTGVVTIFFLVRSKELRQNIWEFLNTPYIKNTEKDLSFTTYDNKGYAISNDDYIKFINRIKKT